MAQPAMRTLFALLFLFTIAANARAGFVPYLVKDLFPGSRVAPVELSYYEGKAVGEVVFFSALGDEPGLWRTDGTAAGTHRIYDGLVEHGGGYGALGATTSEKFFGSVDTWESWNAPYLVTTDGSTPGTQVVQPFRRFGSGVPCGADRVCLTAADGAIWTTDGTTEGTKKVFGASETVPGFYARWLTADGENRLVFNGMDRDHGRCMVVDNFERQICGELWETDGTTEGTRLFKDLVPGIWPGGPYDFFRSSRGMLFFRALDPASPPSGLFCVHWASDGTPGNTRMLGEPRRFSCNSSIFVEADEHVYFLGAFGELFESQGTPETTRSIWPEQTDHAMKPWNLHTSGDRLMLETQQGLARWDGAKPVPLPAPSDVSVLGTLASTGELYFLSEGHLWSTDGTSEGTRKRFPWNASSNVFATTPTRLFTQTRGALFVTDGSERGTRRIALETRVARSSSVWDLLAFGDKVYFRTETPAGLYASDGTADGTVELKERRNGASIYEHEGRLYFTDYSLWTTDGTVEGTKQASDWLGVGSVDHPPAFIGDAAIFGGGDPDVLMRRDAGGTLTELSAPVSGWLSGFTSVHDRVMFARFDREAWATTLNVTDGTRAGTHALASGLTDVHGMATLGTGAMFGARKLDDGPLEVWRTDFTAEGTKLVEVVSSESYDSVLPLAELSGVSLFAVGDARWLAQEGDPLWRTDGTEEGTYRLSAHEFSAAVLVGDHALLVRWLPAPGKGWEIWTSDATEEGTRLVRSGAGTYSGGPFTLPGGDPAIAYTTRSSAPRTLEVLNLRTMQTFEVALGEVGAGQVVSAGGRLFFSGCRGSVGCELWAVALDASVPEPPGEVRIDYVGVAATPTGAGAVFRVHLDPRGATHSRVVASTADGSLRAPEDYVPFSREIVFDDDRDVTLVVPLTGMRNRGSLHLVLSSPTGAVITQGVATAVIDGRRRAARH